MKEALVLLNADVSGGIKLAVSVMPSAVEMKTDALAISRAVLVVKDAAAFVSAGAALSKLKAIIDGVECSRVSVKAPILKAGKDIDTRAKTFVADVLAEYARLDPLVTAYELEQRRAAAAAEAERLAVVQRAEAARIEAERLERERLAELERVKREAAEAAFLTEEPVASSDPFLCEPPLTASEEAFLLETPEERVLSASQAVVSASVQVKTAAAAVQAARVSVPVPAPVRLEGRTFRDVWKFEVVSLTDLAAARPDLVTIVPKAREINAAIAGGKQITGLRVYQDTVSSAR